jgi:hypothetical protein
MLQTEQSRTSQNMRVNLHALLKIMDVYKCGHLGLSPRESESPWWLFNFFFKDTIKMINVESNLAFNPEQLYEALTGPG